MVCPESTDVRHWAKWPVDGLYPYFPPMPESLPSTLHLLGPGIFLFLEFQNPIAWCNEFTFPVTLRGLGETFRKGKNREGGVWPLLEMAGSASHHQPANRALTLRRILHSGIFRTLDREEEASSWKPSCQVLDVTGPRRLQCYLSAFPTGHLDSQ